MRCPMILAALLAACLPLLAPAAWGQNAPEPVFTPQDEGKAAMDPYGTGLYSATCVQGEGCHCATMPIDRATLSVVLGKEVAQSALGLVDSPAVESDLTPETPEALHARYGGEGYCPQSPLAPKDGRWQEGPPTDLSVQCGPGTPMMLQALRNQKRTTAQIDWQGRFSGETVQQAFMAADPDPEYSPHEFKDLTPVETVGTARLSDAGGSITSSGRMRLLTPTLFALDWQVKGQTEMGPCNWSHSMLVHWIGE